MGSQKLNDNHNRYIDRPFNIRPMCFWAFLVGLTIVVCFTNAIILTIYFFVLIGLFFGSQYVKCKDKFVVFLGTSKIFLNVAIVLCLLVTASFWLYTVAYVNQKTYAGIGTITGVVEIYKYNDDESGYLLLHSARFNNEKISGRVQIYFSSLNETSIKNIVTTNKVALKGVLRPSKANSYSINNKVKYNANIDNKTEIESLGFSKSLRSIIMRSTRNFFRRYMNETNSELMYSMILGDRALLDGEVVSDFSIIGLAHVLAISGINVGMIMALFMAVLKIVRVNRKIQFPIIAAILLFYCYLCGWQYAIMRACIMFLILAGNKLLLRSNDMLSTLSAAGIVILVLFPHSLLSVSFQYSFGCMLGMLYLIYLLPIFSKSLYGNPSLLQKDWQYITQLC